MNKKYILKNCIIASSGFFLPDGEILINNNKIEEVGQSGSIKINSNEKIKEYNLGGRLVIPGILNPHSHLYSSLSVGLSPLGANDDFMGVLSNFWWPLDAAMDEESVYYSAMSGILNAIKHGVTCIVDHHASMNYVNGSLDVIKKAFSLTGLKGILCFETSNRKSNSNVSGHIAENISFAQSHFSDGNIKGMVGLHANLTLSDEDLLQVSKAVNEKQDKLSIHIHCGEAKDDYKFCIEKGYKGPVDRLNNFNLIGKNSILAHCVHVSDKDMEIINEIEPWVVFNSESNANNRVGKAKRDNFHRYLIGTDGMSFDMVSSFRSHYLLGKGLSEDFAKLQNVFFDWPEIFLKNYFPNTGKIQKGMDADIAVLDYVPQTSILSENLVGHLIFGAKGGNAYMTISNGNILYMDGKITFTSEESLIKDIKKAAKELHRRYYG